MSESAFETGNDSQRHSKGVNLAQLARHLGISESTVSKALNNRPDVSASLRQQVLDAANALGYRPNPNARKLALGRSGSIGVFLLNRYGRPAGEYFGFNFLGGIMHEAELQNFDILLFSESSELKKSGYLHHAQTKMVEGLIFVDLDHDDPQLPALAQADLPIASIDTPIPGSALPMVASDNREGIRLAVDHLVALGKRKIAFVGIHGEGYIAKERLQGFLDACKHHGIDPPKSWRIQTKLDVDGGYQAGLELVSKKRPPNAIVCAADLQAIGVLKAIQARGLRVPYDVAVTGFDDLPGVGHLSPALTTIAQDAQRIGQEAARLVIAAARQSALKTNKKTNLQVAHTILIQPKLVIRSST